MPLLEELEKRIVFSAVQYTLTNYQVKETSSAAVVTVQLDVPYPLPITVDYSTSNGTAIAGTNYVATSSTLTFAPEQLCQSFQVPILVGRHPGESSETVNLALSNPSNVGLGANATATLTILDKGLHGNDKPTAVALASSRPQCGMEPAGHLYRHHHAGPRRHQNTYRRGGFL